MSQPKMGEGVIVGKNVSFGRNVIIWNYVVVGDNTIIGDNTVIGSFCDIGKNVVVGNDCSIQAHVTISNGCKVGNNVFIAPNTSLLNDKYPKSNLLRPCEIKDKATLGGGVTVLPGVIVGEEAVVGGGSVVTKNVPARTVVKGVPAKFAMALREYEAKRESFLESQ